MLIANGRISLFYGQIKISYLSDIYRYRYITVLICSSIDGHSGGFHVLAMVNNAAVNMRVHISLQDDNFVSFRYISRSGVDGSQGSFKFLRNLHTLFSQWLHQFGFPPTMHKVFLFFSHTHQYLLSLVFLVITIVRCVRWYLIMVNLHFPDDQYCWTLFLHLVPTCFLSLGKCLCIFLWL